MLVKFMPKKRCGLGYCLGEKVRGEDVRHPEVLLGDPAQTKEILKGIDFANPFTSVVLTYERVITPEEASRDIASFEAMVLPGMKAGLEYDRVWIRHTETPKDPETRKPDPTKPQRTALHCIIPNVHLPTGKRLQPYYDPVDRKRVEAWQELTNEAHGYASAKDPERRRASVLNLNRLPQKVAELKATLTQAVVANLQAEQINTRADLCAWLGEQGFRVERTTNKSISISHPSLNKNLRLEGEIYELGGIENAARARDTGEKPERRVGPDRSAEYRRNLSEGIERKRVELEARFPRRNQELPGRAVEDPRERAGQVVAATDERERGVKQGPAQAVDMGTNRDAGDRLHHGGPDRGVDLVADEPRHRPGADELAAGASHELGGPARPGGDGAGQARGAKEEYSGSKYKVEDVAGGLRRGAGELRPVEGEQSVRADAGAVERVSADRQPGQADRELRGGGAGRSEAVEDPKRGMGNRGETQKLTYADETNRALQTIESDPARASVARFVRELIDRTGRALERLGETVERGFRLSQASLSKLAQATPVVATAYEGIGRAVRAARRLGAHFERGQSQERATGHDLQQRGGRFQLDEGRVHELSLPGERAAQLVRGGLTKRVEQEKAERVRQAAEKHRQDLIRRQAQAQVRAKIIKPPSQDRGNYHGR